MPGESRPNEPFQESLERLEGALARTRAVAAPARLRAGRALAGKSTGAAARPVGVGAVVVGVVLLLAGFAAEVRGLLWPGLLLGALGLVLLARRTEGLFSSPRRHSKLAGPSIGMGATIASNARLAAGSVVEMGATIGDSAQLERGAVVRMGATIGPHAIVEEGATVSWGVSVGSGAVIGAGAVVAAGSDVQAGARVPPHTSMLPGTSWNIAMGGTGARVPSLSPRASSGAVDPRAERIRQACDRLEAEFAGAPEPVRAMFGDSEVTLSSLRRTCFDLLAREQDLRAEASPEAVARLDQEKLALETRLLSVTDEHVRRSLTGAVAAIEAQRRQRQLLQKSAERLEAELTRLTWTLDGMCTELLRVRTVGADLYASSASGLTQSVQQLQNEIDSIAEALEEVQRDESHAESIQGNLESAAPPARTRVQG